MKKKRLKNYLKLGVLLFGIFISLWSCEKETTFIEPETSNSPNQLKLSESSFSELFKTEKFKNAYLKTISKKQILSKGTLYVKNTSESIYEFTINSSSIKQIDYKKSTSYTMFIRRKEKTETSFENLVIKIDSSQNVNAYILKYTYTSEPILNTAHNNYSFDGDVEVTKIDYNKINGLQSKMQYACTDVYQVKCNGGTGGCNGSWHTPGQICYDLFSQCISLTQVGMDCGYFDDGTDGSSGSGSNNGEGGTTSGGGDGSSSDPNNNDPNQLVTIPNDCKTCPDEFDDTVFEDDCNTSKEDLKKIFPNISDANAELLTSIINDKGKDFGINSDEDLWHFLSQAGHETGGFNTLNVTESTYWTTASKLAVTYSRFTMDSTLAVTNANKYYAPDYLRNSSGVANIAMCCKYGNGDVASGDGYKYRGRGLFQLTWKDNYTAFKTWYNNKYDPDIDPVTTPNIIASNDTLAILSGLWYYKTKVVDKITIDSTTTVSKVTGPINPKLKGLKDRKQRFQKAKDSINCL